MPHRNGSDDHCRAASMLQPRPSMMVASATARPGATPAPRGRPHATERRYRVALAALATRLDRPPRQTDLAAELGVTCEAVRQANRRFDLGFGARPARPARTWQAIHRRGKAARGRPPTIAELAADAGVALATAAAAARRHGLALSADRPDRLRVTAAAVRLVQDSKGWCYLPAVAAILGVSDRTAGARVTALVAAGAGRKIAAPQGGSGGGRCFRIVFDMPDAAPARTPARRVP